MFPCKETCDLQSIILTMFSEQRKSSVKFNLHEFKTLIYDIFVFNQYYFAIQGGGTPGRGRKKGMQYAADPNDTDKPFSCDRKCSSFLFSLFKKCNFIKFLMLILLSIVI